MHRTTQNKGMADVKGDKDSSIVIVRKSNYVHKLKRTNSGNVKVDMYKPLITLK